MASKTVIEMAREAGWKDLPTVRLAFAGFNIKAFEALVRADERESAPNSNEAKAAIDTLEFLGYTYHGGEKWKPPLGNNPIVKPLGFMNAGHVHELQQGRLPYGYVYPKEGVGAEVAIYTSPVMHLDTCRPPSAMISKTQKD